MNTPECGGREPIEINVTQGESYWWCTCGKSQNQPFCDGSHKGSAFAPLEYIAEADGPVWFCACKQTKNPPECDGSHNQLSTES